MTQTAKDLRAAMSRIEKPEWWTKRVLARNANKRKTTPLSDDASCFCAEGALMRATGNHDLRLKKAVNALREDLMGRPLTAKIKGIMYFNDHPDTTHADIVDLFKRAIAAEERA